MGSCCWAKWSWQINPTNTLAGIITDYEGSIEGINPSSVAYLPQQTKLDKDFPITVFELISTGLWQEVGFSGGLSLFK